MLCRIRTLVCSRLRAPCCSRQASTLKDATDRLESKWQTQWRREAASAQVDNKLSTPDDKFYVLSMFPYPSGRLHMGHVRVYTISDTLAHFYRMRGKKVLHPMGWDAFGLPAENAAIERNTNPSDWTQDNVSNMRSQLLSLGCHFDWHREVSTCSPEYYRWTQWLFLQLYNHGLAYKKKAMVNWDPVDQTVLANEQVDENGCSWRSGAKVEQRYLDQWFFKITDYAEPLLQGLEELDWPNKVKLMQADWIGKSEGAFFDFRLQGIDVPPLRVFTTRPDTIYGVTFMALSPEHDLLQNTQLFDEAVLQAVRELQRDAQEPGTQQDKSKEGICLDVSVVHPFTGASIPLYVADYVVSDYGTKAIMGVPAHDERDYEFAMEHHLPVAMVIESEEGGGILIHSEQFSGLSAEEGGRAIVEHACSQDFGGHMTQYKLRDWLISRQRYWGAPIPIMYCDKCGIVPVPEDQLPVLLPLDVQFTGRGPSPLTQTKEWLNTTCGKPNCSARRETDTMDTFVDSSWYFLRYINPHDNERPFTSDANQWMPVDLYIGGIEHAILHLLYARFVTHFLHNIGAISVREPFNKLLTQGMVQGRTYRLKESGQYLRPEERAGVMDEGGPNVEVSWEKMSKSKHNGVDPQDIIREYGADTVRLFMLFKAPPEAAIQWDIRTIQGVHKWLHRLSVLCQKHVEACTRSSSLSAECDPTMAEQRRKIVSATHRAIRQVTVAFEEKYTFNVAVSELMILSNHLRDSAAVMCTAEYHRALSTLFTMLAPMAPHIACQLWEDLKETSSTLNLETPKGSVLEQRWPTWNQDLIQEENAEVVLQVNGRKKGVISLPVDLIMEHEDLETEARRRAEEMGIISSDNLVKKVFVAPSGKVVNFVIK